MVEKEKGRRGAGEVSRGRARGEGEQGREGKQGNRHRVYKDERRNPYCVVCVYSTAI